MSRNKLKPKLITVLKEGYSIKKFVPDLIAGIIVGIVALPLAIAFAIASGVKPEQGLYTAVVAGFIISLGIIFGTLPFLFSIIMTGFELFVAVLQAYIFAILVCAYIGEVTRAH